MSAIREPRNSKGITKTRLINKLIRLYHTNECLWNPKSPGYHNLALKDKAWQRISVFFKDDHLTIEQLQLMIISLRYYYERERLAIMTNRLNGVCYAPRHSYYNKLHFLNPESDPINTLTNCNKQINRIVEDTFLVGNNQKCIHSENVDVGLPFVRNEDNIGQDLSGKVAYRFDLPLPPLEIQRSRLQYRSVSGCDRSRSQFNFNIANDEDNSLNGQNRPLPPTSDDQSNNNCHCLSVLGECCDLPVPYKRKLLTGSYPRKALSCMPNSQGKLNQQARMSCGKDSEYICNNRNDQTSSRRGHHVTCPSFKWSPEGVDNQAYQQQQQYNQHQQYNQQQYKQQQQYNQQHIICNNPICKHKTPQPIAECQKQHQYEDLYRQYDYHQPQSVNKQAQNDNRSRDQYAQSRRSSCNGPSTRQGRNSRDITDGVRRAKDATRYENSTSTKGSGNQEDRPLRDAKKTYRSQKTTPNCVEYIECPASRQRDPVRDSKIVTSPKKTSNKNPKEFIDSPGSSRRLKRLNECHCGQDCSCQRKIIIYCTKSSNPNLNNVEDYDEYPSSKEREISRSDRGFEDVPDKSQKVYCMKMWNPTSKQYDECPSSIQSRMRQKDFQFYDVTEDESVNDPKNSYSNGPNLDIENSKQYVECPSVKRAEMSRNNKDFEDARSYCACEHDKLPISSLSKYCECNQFEEYPEIMPYGNDCDCQLEDTPEIKLYCAMDDWEEEREKRSEESNQNSAGAPDDPDTDATYYEMQPPGEDCQEDILSPEIGNQPEEPQYNEASVETDIDMTLRCRNKESCSSNCSLSCKQGQENQENGAEYSDSCVETEIDMTLNCRSRECSCRKANKAIRQSNKKAEEIRKELPKCKKGNQCVPIVKTKCSLSSKKLKPICKCRQPVHDKGTNKSRPASPSPKQRSVSSGPPKCCGKPCNKIEDVSGFQQTGNLATSRQVNARPDHLLSEYLDHQEEPSNSERIQSFSISPRHTKKMFFQAMKLGSQRTVPAKNPFRNLNLNASKREIIMLYPPVKGFRPSKYSIDIREQFSIKSEIDL